MDVISVWIRKDKQSYLRVGFLYNFLNKQKQNW